MAAKCFCFLIIITCFVAASPMIFKPVTHVIFDLDGTLIDTESCYKDAANNVTSRYGMEFTWENKSKLMGVNLRDNSQRIVDAFHLPITGQEFYDQVMQAFGIFITEVPFMPGAERIVRYFHENHIHLSLCTGARNDSYFMKVNHFGDFFKPGKYFDVIVTGSDPEITHHKPDPEPYLVTLRRLPGNPKPENVLVFEDSFDGVTSAIAAGTQCVMVPDSRVDNGNATSAATLVIKSLNDFDPTLFGLPKMTSSSSKLFVTRSNVEYLIIIFVIAYLLN